MNVPNFCAPMRGGYFQNFVEGEADGEGVEGHDGGGVVWTGEVAPLRPQTARQLGGDGAAKCGAHFLEVAPLANLFFKMHELREMVAAAAVRMEGGGGADTLEGSRRRSSSNARAAWAKCSALAAPLAKFDKNVGSSGRIWRARRKRGKAWVTLPSAKREAAAPSTKGG